MFLYIISSLKIWREKILLDGILTFDIGHSDLPKDTNFKFAVF